MTPQDLLKTLIRFNTTNPPGNEAECIAYLENLCREGGLETTILAFDENRPNLIARLKGRGERPPLLMQGHVDVVTTEGQPWTYPPFDAVEADGFIWGRGALDMKGGVAMMVCAVLAQAQKEPPAGDIILCIMSDEEASGTYGAKFLVEQHADQFEGVEMSIGEFGGFPNWIGGTKFYPIQVSEKVAAHLRVVVEGSAGHGSLPIQGGTLAKLAQVLSRLDGAELPIHITPSVEAMIRGIASASSGATKLVMNGLLQPSMTSFLLRSMSSQLGPLTPTFRNTVSPTILHGSDKINVIPAQASVELDGRMLPNFDVHEFVREVQQVVGDAGRVEIVSADPPSPIAPDMKQLPLLSNILSELDPTGTPIPFVLPAVTDGRFFSRLGIHNYGFLPLQLPEGFNFSATIHAADERVPVAALDFGMRALEMLIERYTV